MPHTAAATSQDLPDAEALVQGYMAMRAWTDDLAPPSLDDSASRLPLPGASGVCVIARHNGRVVGSATVTPGQASDDLMIRRALGRALAATLGDPAVTSLPRELQDEIGTRLTLELEVAGEMQPLLARTYADVAEDLEPGIDGIAMRRGNRWAMLFPSTMLASNTAGNVATRLTGLAVQLGLPTTELRTLVREHRVSVYRFSTVHLAQQSPDAFPFETLRGGRLVADRDVTAQSIARFADALAAHIGTRLPSSDEPEPGHDEDTEPSRLGMLGTYRPVADSYNPLTASPLDQALMSFALSRYARAPLVSAEQAAASQENAQALLEHLAARDELLEQTDTTFAAAVMLAFSEAQPADPAGEAVNDLRTRARVQLVDAVTKLHVPDDPVATSMVAAAAAAILDHDEAALSPGQVRSVIDAAWSALPEHQHVALLPWIGWAELDLAAAADQPIANASLLRNLRRVLNESRVSGDEAAADLRGGFALAGPAGSRPTAQSLRPAAFLATMLTDSTLTPDDERSLALGRHLRTMRFVLQLQMREELAWAVRNPRRAVGGMRAAPWDSDMPTAAQAMGLLTAAETLIGLDQR